MSSAARANLWRTLPLVAVGGGVVLAAIYMRNRGTDSQEKIIIVENNAVAPEGEKEETPVPAEFVDTEDSIPKDTEQESNPKEDKRTAIEDLLKSEQPSQSLAQSTTSAEQEQTNVNHESEADDHVELEDNGTDYQEEEVIVQINDVAPEEEKEETPVPAESMDTEDNIPNETEQESGPKEDKRSAIEDLLKSEQPSFCWVQSTTSAEQEQENGHHEFGAGDHVGFEDNGSDSQACSEPFVIGGPPNYRFVVAVPTHIPPPPMPKGMKYWLKQNVLSNASSSAASEASSSDESVSADSGRASGGMACSLSPGVGDVEGEMLPMYEFEIPNTLVGLIIGIRGKTIKELCTRAEVKMIIRPHHNPEKSDSHQICTVEGKRDCINKCLRLLRRRFPSNRFPDLNLKPVMPPPMPCPAAEIFGNQPTNLALPDGVRCEVVISSMLNPGHFFVQQPTHPTFSQLQRLDRYMLGIYSQTSGIPELPQPCAVGLLCVAPSLTGWFRAVTMAYYEDQDEVLVRYVDYGGYSRVPRSDLRQIRTDLMTLPFQATECYLANVQPADGTSQWSEQANEEVQNLFTNKIVEAKVIGYNIEDQIPVVELFTTTLDDDNKPVKLDKYLLDKDLAKLADPSKVVPVSPK